MPCAKQGINKELSGKSTRNLIVGVRDAPLFQDIQKHYCKRLIRAFESADLQQEVNFVRFQHHLQPPPVMFGRFFQQDLAYFLRRAVLNRHKACPVNNHTITPSFLAIVFFRFP